jgi:hypothetical protein
MKDAVILPVEEPENPIEDDCKLRVVDLSPNIGYYFQVRAENEIGISQWSETSKEIKTRASVPSACQHVQVISNVYERMQVQWHAPETFGLTINSFVVRWLKAEHPMKEQSRLEVPAVTGSNRQGNKMSTWVDSIKPGSKLVFQVAARSDAGIGPFSEISDVVIACAGKPGTPLAPVLKLRTSTSIIVQLEDKTEQNGAPITAYECRWDLSSTMTSSVKITGNMKELPRRPGLPRIYEIAATGLKKRGPYYFSVRAENRIGWSYWSPPSEAMMLHFVAPSKMSAPHFVETQENALVIGYTPSAEMGMTQGGNVLEYELRYSRRCELLDQGDDSVFDHEDVFITQFPAKKSLATYADAAGDELRAVFKDAAGDRGATLSRTQGVADKALRDEIKGLQATHKDQLKTIKQNADAMKAEVQVDFNPGGPPPPNRVESLLTGRSYHFQVRAITENGSGPWSEISPAFEVVPSRPENPVPPEVELGTDGPYSIQLSITLPEHNGRKIDSCSLMMYGPVWEDQEGSPEWRDLYSIKPQDVHEERRERAPVRNASEPGWETVWHHTVIHLEAGAAYQFMCRCENQVGCSEWSEPSTVIATDSTVPHRCLPPYVEKDEDKTSTSLKVKWDAPHNGGSPIKHYLLHWASNPRFAGYKSIECKETELSLTGLEPYQWYYMKVAAVNVIGRGRYSDFDSAHSRGCFLTLATVPSTVINLTAEIMPDEVVRLRWEKPATSGGHIISRYKVIAVGDSNCDTKDHFEFSQLQNASRECYLKDLSPDTLWSFKVAAGTKEGFGPESDPPAQLQTPKILATKAIAPCTPAPPDCTFTTNAAGKCQLQMNWKCPEDYDRKKGFIYKTGVQTHMILTYNVKIMAGTPIPEFAEKLVEHTEFKQVRDRRTVPKNVENCIVEDNLMPGRHYTAMVQSVSEAGMSGWSKPSPGVWSEGASASIPTEFQLVDRSISSLTLQWVCPHGNGADITAFRLRWKWKRSTKRRLWSSKSPSIKLEPTDEDSDDSGSGWDDDDDNMGNLALPGDPDFDVDSGIHGSEVLLDDCKCGPELEMAEDVYAPRGRTNCGRICRWTLTGLTPGRFYVAELQAFNGIAHSPWAHSGNLRTAPTSPDAPFGLRGLPDTATQTGVSFCWEAPEETGGEPVEGYEVAWMRIAYRETLPQDTATILATENCQERKKLDIDARLFRAEGLAPGNVAIPIVRCWNNVGCSDWAWLCGKAAGSLEEVLEQLAAKPSAPSPVLIPPVLEKAAPIKSDRRPYSLTATWKCPEVNGCPVQYFLLKICMSGEPPALTETDKLTTEKEMRLDHDGTSADWHEGDDISLSFVNEGLVPGAPYVLNVRACTGDQEVGDCMDWGAVSQPQLAPPDLPLQPIAPTCPWQWPDALQIEWQEPCMSGAPQTRCEARYSREVDMSDYRPVRDECLVKAVESKAVKVEGLKYTTEYYFQYRIANEVGWSPWSQVSPAILTKACRPEEPLQLEPLNVQKEDLTLKWQVPSDHGATITQFELILVDTLKCSDFMEIMKKANKCNYVSDDYETEPAEAAMWEVLNTAELKSQAQKDVKDPNDPSEALHSFSGLLGGITYSMVVRACNRCGWSDWSQIMSTKTPNAEPERCPQAVLLQPFQNSVSVEYQLPYDNGLPITKLEFTWCRVTGPKDRHKARVLGGRAEDHRIEATGAFVVSFGVNGEAAPEPAPPHGYGGKGNVTVDGLEPGTEYDIQYRAFNAIGPGLCSHTIHILTAPGKPDAPGKVRHSQADSDNQESAIMPQAPEDAAPPTVCFARTARLQASEVVHVRQSRSPTGTSSQMQSLGEYNLTT